ncbi:hypothetical protein KP509_15G077100 [Ceratopteris richardii]|uniref:Uncharacterized protein n=1 Tax=Ceratopteris richardii TaxID=49495 RepID=A0A8T2T9K0_CERRI|nr:hypothetical protein KP509_15G077100 [Ceratopteris richardii]
MPDFTLKSLGLQLSGEEKFTITLADQSRVKPLGSVEKVPVEMDGLTFFLDFVVLNLQQVNGGFPLLIGRPWLRHIQAMHDWGNDTILVNLPRKVQKQVHLDPKGSHGGNARSRKKRSYRPGAGHSCFFGGLIFRFPKISRLSDFGQVDRSIFSKS